MQNCKASLRALAIWQIWIIFMSNLVPFHVLDDFGENPKLRYPHICTIHEHLIIKQPLETSIHKSVMPSMRIEP
jgi:hypothetical protein